MARAKVNYTAGLTYERAGRRFVKGQPQILTDPGEIAHYRATSGFVVSMLDEPKKEKAIAPPEPPKKSSGRNKAPPPSPEDEEMGEDLDIDEDETEEDEDADDSAEV